MWIFKSATYDAQTPIDQMCDFSWQRRSSYTSRVWVMHYITSIQFYFAACRCQQSVTICLGVTANLTSFDLWVAQLEAMSLPVQHLFCSSGSDLIDRIWMTLGQAKRPRVAMESSKHTYTQTRLMNPRYRPSLAAVEFWSEFGGPLSTLQLAAEYLLLRQTDFK